MQTPVLAPVLTSPIKSQIARRSSADGYEETDTYTTTNEDLAFKSLKNNRKIIKFTGDPKSNIINHKFTEYSQRLQVQAKQKFKYRVRSLLYREIPTYLRQMHYEVRRSLKRARLSLERPGLRD